MSKNKNIIRDIIDVLLTIIGILATLCCFALIGVGAMTAINHDLLIMRLAIIAGIAFSIKLIIELISREETWICSIICITCSCGCIIMSAVNLL